MKFLTEKKKLFALIALICFAVTFLTNGIAKLVDTVNLFSYMFTGFGQFMIAAISISNSVLSVAAIACYAGSAFFVWKKDNHMKLLGLAGLCSIAVLFLEFAGQITSFITYEHFQFTVLVSQFFGNCMPFLVAAYLIVFSLVKVKGPVVPIAGAALIVLFCGSEILGMITSVINSISFMTRYFSWDDVWYLITNLFGSGTNIVCCVGLLLLAPAAFYLPKEEAAEAEAPAIEQTEAPAAE